MGIVRSLKIGAISGAAMRAAGPIHNPRQPGNDMDPSFPILKIAVTAVVAGVLGGSAMVVVMRLITRAEWARYDMIVALGSLVTRSKENAFRTGAIIHVFSAVGFALLYSAIMWRFGLNQM